MRKVNYIFGYILKAKSRRYPHRIFSITKEKQFSAYQKRETLPVSLLANHYEIQS